RSPSKSGGMVGSSSLGCELAPNPSRRAPPCLGRTGVDQAPARPADWTSRREVAEPRVGGRRGARVHAVRPAVDELGAVLILLRNGEIERAEAAAEIMHHGSRIVVRQLKRVLRRLALAGRRGLAPDVLVAEAEDVPQLVPEDADLVEREVGFEVRGV